MATSLATALLPAPQLGLGESILFGVVAVIAVVCALACSPLSVRSTRP